MWGIVLLLLFSVRIDKNNIPINKDVIYPTTMVPAFVQLGGDFSIITKYKLYDVNSIPITACNNCKIKINFCNEHNKFWVCSLNVNKKCEEGLYDLELKFVNNYKILQKKALRVINHKEDLILILTGDHQLGDPSWKLGKKKTPIVKNNIFVTKREIKEFEIIQPDIVIHLGDLIFGSKPQEELIKTIKIWNNRNVAITFLPGNHDGYALYDINFPDWHQLVFSFHECRNMLKQIPVSWKEKVIYMFKFLSCIYKDTKEYMFKDLRIDSLNLWKNEIGPIDRSFIIGKYCFILFNSYSGSPKRRHSFVLPVSFLDRFFPLFKGVPLVDNYGGELTHDQLLWIKHEMENCYKKNLNILLFAHHDPRGNLKQQRYVKDDPFPTDPLSLNHFEEWNFNPKIEDENNNSGTNLLKLLAKYGGWYFSGHVHYGEIYEYKKDSQIIPGIKANKKVVFVKVPTGASMTRNDSWWGYSVISLLKNGKIKIVLDHKKPIVAAGGIGWQNNKLRSLLPYPVPIKFLSCLNLNKMGYTLQWGRLLTCPTPYQKGASLFIWEGVTPVSDKTFSSWRELLIKPEVAKSNTPPNFEILGDNKLIHSKKIWNIKELKVVNLHDENGVFEPQWIIGNKTIDGTSLLIPKDFYGKIIFEVRDGLCAWKTWSIEVIKFPKRVNVIKTPSGCSCAQGCSFGYGSLSLLFALVLVISILVTLRKRI